MTSKIAPFATALLTLLILISQTARAEITVFNQNDYTFSVGGFIESDAIFDTTRSLTEVAGNTAIAKKGTFAGENPRTQFSLRNSRLIFNFTAPVTDGWKTRGYLENDFLGYDPSPAVGQTEASNATNPTLRIRHAYLAAENGSFKILAGQNWTLFGWEPDYVLATVSEAPVAGTMYQRTPRIGAVDTLAFGEGQRVELGLSLSRPTQKDSAIPNVDGGIRWSNDNLKSGFSAPTGDIKTQPLSVGLSGTFREFESPQSFDQKTYSPAAAMAVNALIPILTSDDGKSTAHTLTLTGEFTVGRGYSDEFPSFTGGLVQEVAGSSNTNGSNVNLDPGLGGYNAQGSFELVHLRTFNAQLQYHLSGDTYATLGYGQIYSDNVNDFAGGVGQNSSSLYDSSETYFLNLVHDFTSKVRLAGEVSQFATHYVLGGITHDNRAMLSAFYRF